MRWISSKIRVIKIGVTICLLVPLFVLTSSAAEEGPEAVIQLFYKALREGKDDEARTYLSLMSQQHWADIAHPLTKNGTLQTVEVGGVTKISAWLMKEETRIVSVVARFTDGSSQRLRIALVKEVDAWKLFWIGKIREEQAFQDYVVRFYRQDYVSRLSMYSDYFEILQGGHRVHMSDLTAGISSFSLSHQGHYDQKGNYTEKVVVPMGKDITGDSKPNLVVVEWSGGGHCCVTYYVFEIGQDNKTKNKEPQSPANNEK